jgi:mediator of RNA polymerase II transcription subunit 31
MSGEETKIEEEEKALTPDEKRFLLDLEFVQFLANPSYLQYLATHEAKYFTDERFAKYLKYLLYFKDPKYSQYIQYPHSLFVLDLLQDETFRSQVPVAPVLIDAFAEQQKLHWMFYRANRIAGQTPNGGQ